MNHGRKYGILRCALMTAFFSAGLILVFAGWYMTGELSGLGIMLLGMLLMLTALFVYNKAYQ